MRRVHVELHGQTLGDEMLGGERPRQLDPVLMAELAVRRQGQDDLAGDLRVLAPLRRLRRVPQGSAVGEPGAGTLGQEDLVMLGGTAVRERVPLAGALVLERRPLVVGRRAHRRAAGGTADVAGAGEGDRHGRGRMRMKGMRRKPAVQRVGS